MPNITTNHAITYTNSMMTMTMKTTTTMMMMMTTIKLGGGCLFKIMLKAKLKRGSKDNFPFFFCRGHKQCPCYSFNLLLTASLLACS